MSTDTLVWVRSHDSSLSRHGQVTPFEATCVELLSGLCSPVHAKELPIKENSP